MSAAFPRLDYPALLVRDEGPFLPADSAFAGSLVVGDSVDAKRGKQLGKCVDVDTV